MADDKLSLARVAGGLTKHKFVASVLPGLSCVLRITEPKLMQEICNVCVRRGTNVHNDHMIGMH